MFKIEKATAGDFENIYPFLQKLNDRDLSKEDWGKLFVNYWKSPEDFFGYTLVKDGEVKGFLGLIFSRRTFNNEVYKFCNLTSWIVDEDCRSQSLLPLLAALKLKDYAFTCFTAGATTGKVLNRLGFTELLTSQQILLPIPNFRLKKQDSECEFDPAKIRNRLNENDRTIFDDHQYLNCEHLLLTSRERYCYLVLKKTHRRNIALAKIHYISDTDFFAECIEIFAVKICRRLKVFGLIIDERYLENRRLRKSVKYPKPQKIYFKANSKTLNENQIDTLYSEMVVLYNPKIAV